MTLFLLTLLFGSIKRIINFWSLTEVEEKDCYSYSITPANGHFVWRNSTFILLIKLLRTWSQNMTSYCLIHQMYFTFYTYTYICVCLCMYVYLRSFFIQILHHFFSTFYTNTQFIIINNTFIIYKTPLIYSWKI